MRHLHTMTFSPDQNWPSSLFKTVTTTCWLAIATFLTHAVGKLRTHTQSRKRHPVGMILWICPNNYYSNCCSNLSKLGCNIVAYLVHPAHITVGVNSTSCHLQISTSIATFQALFDPLVMSPHSSTSTFQVLVFNHIEVWMYIESSQLIL